jgi:hypothetical protein
VAKKQAVTQFIPTDQIASEVDNAIQRFATQRMPFERRWYDNNFFDDGFHFRYLSPKTGKIVDTSTKSYQSSPKRSIPKASRQIRGVASLLLQLEPHPVIYPERINPSLYPPIETPEGLMENPQLKEALKRAKDEAKKKAWWVENEWDDHDMDEKLVFMMILAAKHGISYLQLWNDAKSGESKSKVWDAFDIYLDGTLTSIYDSPMISKTTPVLIDKIKSNEMFDEAQRMRISPDNRYASSEVKEAYMTSRFGSGGEVEAQKTLIQKETFQKEYLTSDNWEQAKSLGADNGAMEGKSRGDIIMRHVFSTSNGWLMDEYVDMLEYPLVDFRFEPGLIYQVPLIERFIPANKSLDIAMSRIEGYANTMVTGIYQKRKGENFKISNIPGGQVLEYEGMPLQQMQLSSVPAFMFKFIDLLEAHIEEQGASVSTMNKLPEGVKSGVAIESVKASEYANLIIPTKSFKKTVKRITERLLELGADNITSPKEVVHEEGDEAVYFDVIGESGVEKYKEALMDVPDGAVVLKKGTKVRIEIESGLGYTVQGKKETMQQIANYMLELANAGMVNPAQVQVLLQRFLEIFQFGSTAEFMEAVESGQVEMTQQNLDQVKIAVLEVLKDVGLVGPEGDQRAVDATKVGLLETLKETGGQNADVQG